MMTQEPRMFQHTFNSAWLVLATHEAVRPPFIFDLSLQLGGLIEEGSPLVLVEGPGSDRQGVEALLERLQDSFAPGEIKLQALEDFALDQSAGRVGVLVLYAGAPQDWAAEASRFQTAMSSPDLPLVDLTLVIGGACAAVGEWQLTGPSSEAVGAGLGWLPKGIVTPGLSRSADLPAVRDLLAHETRSFAIGLPPGGSIALGPSGELEIWSEVRPGVILGKGWGQA
jgi:hypothetical protein